MKGYVYFIQAGQNGPIKIGYTKNYKARIQFGQTFNHNKLRFLKIIQADISLESELHRKFSKYRIRGEWFEPSKEILDYVAGASEIINPLDKYTWQELLIAARVKLMQEALASITEDVNNKIKSYTN